MFQKQRFNKKKFSNFREKSPTEEEDATPWDVLKSDLLASQEQKSNKPFEKNNKLRAEFLKKREENYKKFLIEQRQQMTVKWDSFSEDERESVVASNTETYKNKLKKKRQENEESEDNSRLQIKKLKKNDDNMIIQPDTEVQNKMVKIKEKLKAKYNNEKWKNVPEIKVNDVTNNDSRKERHREKNTDNSWRCLACRQLGHRIKDCKMIANKSVCIKCGSEDHKHHECPIYKGANFQFATCFICKEMGHISKQCKQNTSGVYPNGGSCNFCRAVDHLAKDCPTNNKKRGGRKRHINKFDKKKYFRRN